MALATLPWSRMRDERCVTNPPSSYVHGSTAVAKDRESKKCVRYDAGEIHRISTTLNSARGRQRVSSSVLIGIRSDSTRLGDDDRYLIEAKQADLHASKLGRAISHGRVELRASRSRSEPDAFHARCPPCRFQPR